jgi:membrane protein required for beta-lactamase induction
MSINECNQERFSSRSVGFVVLAVSMLMFVVGLVVLPVVGFFFAVPLLVLGLVLIFAPESAACRLIRKKLPFS